MTLNGVMAITLRYFTEFGKPVLQKTICGGIYARVCIVFLLCVQCRRKESSRSLSHLLMSFLFFISLEPLNDLERRMSYALIQPFSNRMSVVCPLTLFVRYSRDASRSRDFNDGHNRTNNWSCNGIRWTSKKLLLYQHRPS